jgi:predicted aconitase
MGTTNGLLRLSATESEMLAGDRGEAVAIAMRLIVALANAGGAERLVGIESAHIDGCLYHGQVGLDFAEKLAAAGGRTAVPTTLNVSALDLLHPELIRLDAETRVRARRLMDAYVQMGCEPTWTCAPYQLPDRPTFGAHIAWAESNAIVFANSVLGARTNRYGDFTDICAALTGRVPYSGLHRNENRRARVVFRLNWPGPDHPAADELFGLIGIIVGQESGSLVPAIVGLPRETTEDQLKALAAATASSGATAMFHAVGITPEAPTLSAALGGLEPEAVIDITAARLRDAWQGLSTSDGSRALTAVSVGTPHFSLEQLHELGRLLDGKAIHPSVEMYASTARHTLAALESDGVAADLREAGVTLVVDTCTYVTPVLRAPRGSTVMTDSAKWAWYAPGNLGVDVVYGSLADCVRSAVAGKLVRTPPAALDG